MFYDNLTADQVTSTYGLFNFLMRLRVIGHLAAHTEQADIGGGDIFGDYVLHDFTGANYSIVKDGYSSSKKVIESIEIMEKLFGRLHDKQLRGI